MLDFKLYLISDRTQCIPSGLADTLVQACQAGVRGIQIREKDLTPGDLLTLTCEIKTALKPYQPAILINDRADIARAAGINGVHLPESGLSPAAARSCLSADNLIGVSTHSVDVARAAEDQGADFITFSPIFFTPSKESYGDPQGLTALAHVTQSVNLPVFALGGITPERAIQCLDAGAHGVAVISAILGAPDVFQAVGEFAAVMGQI